MKRYGKQATIELLKKGGFIRYNEYFSIDGGFRVYDENGERVGFITCDLFAALWQMGDGDLVKVYWGYSYSDYALPRVIELEEETTDTTPEEAPEQEQPRNRYAITYKRGDLYHSNIIIATDENNRVLKINPAALCVWSCGEYVYNIGAHIKALKKAHEDAKKAMEKAREAFSKYNELTRGNMNRANTHDGHAPHTITR